MVTENENTPLSIYDGYIKRGLSNIKNKNIDEGIEDIKLALTKILTEYGHIEAERKMEEYELEKVGFTFKK
jgi:hypothetical protein